MNEIKNPMKQMVSDDKIFSGDYSHRMWDEINALDATSTGDEIRAVLYGIGCRLQEFESKVDKQDLSNLLNGHLVRRFLENLQDRACKAGLPSGVGLSEFTDYLRGLYPEHYTKLVERKDNGPLDEDNTKGS